MAIEESTRLQLLTNHKLLEIPLINCVPKNLSKKKRGGTGVEVLLIPFLASVKYDACGITCAVILYLPRHRGPACLGNPSMRGEKQA